MVIGLTDIGLKQGLYHPDVTVRQVQPFVAESVSVRETDCNRLFHDYLLRSLSHTGYVDARCQRQAIFGSRYRLLGHEVAIDGKYLHALVGGSGDDYLALAAGDEYRGRCGCFDSTGAIVVDAQVVDKDIGIECVERGELQLYGLAFVSLERSLYLQPSLLVAEVANLERFYLLYSSVGDCRNPQRIDVAIFTIYDIVGIEGKCRSFETAQVYFAGYEGSRVLQVGALRAEKAVVAILRFDARFVGKSFSGGQIVAVKSYDSSRCSVGKRFDERGCIGRTERQQRGVHEV